MGSGSEGRQGTRAARGTPEPIRRAKAVAELPNPSITLDVGLPLVNGVTDQMRPTFHDFDDAIEHLKSLKTRWGKELRFHRNAAAQREVRARR